MRYSTKNIEDIIFNYLPDETGYPVKVIQAMNYAFKAGGKRLRPMMMKLCYDLFACEEKLEIIAPFMSAIEMIHTYSLIHDDLPALDNDELRRGKPTVHVQFGEDIAILAGDGLLNFAYETAAKSFLVNKGDYRVEKAYMLLTSKPGIHGMIGGQTLDVIMSGRKPSLEELEYVYLNKTSALIECSMMIGAILGGADDASVDKICQIARAVGMAFQVQDDILDILGDEAKLGKPLKSDEKNDKYTYVTIYGIEASAKYVEDMSNEAVSILNGLENVNIDAKNDLLMLIKSLINRDK